MTAVTERVVRAAHPDVARLGPGLVTGLGAPYKVAGDKFCRGA